MTMRNPVERPFTMHIKISASVKAALEARLMIAEMQGKPMTQSKLVGDIMEEWLAGQPDLVSRMKQIEALLADQKAQLERILSDEGADS